MVIHRLEATEIGMEKLGRVKCNKKSIDPETTIFFKSLVWLF